ncbi:MAG: ATP-binding protein [Bacteroidota bacterium]
MVHIAQHLCCFFLLLLPLLSSGQDYTFLAREIGADGDLNNSRITAIAEDPDGFIWMTTLEGVARYDGYQVEWFTHANTELRNIPSQVTLPIDAEGYLWLTKNGQLDLLHYRTFEVIRGEDKFKSTFPEGFRVEWLYGAKDGRILFTASTQKQKNHFLYHPSEGLQRIPIPGTLSKLLPKENSVWSTSNGYVFQEYDLKTGEVLNQVTFPPSNSSPLTCLIDVPMAGDWFGTFDDTTREARVIRLLEGRTELMTSVAVEDDPIVSQSLFFYHPQSGLIVLDFNKKKGEGLSVLDQEWQLKQLQNGQTADIDGRIIYCDRQGILWIMKRGKCTLGQIKRSAMTRYGDQAARGLWTNEKILLEQNLRFKRSVPDSVYSMSYKPPLFCFDQKNKDQCWTGNSRGILQLALEEEGIVQFFPYTKEIADRNYPSLWSILRDKEGQWWGGLMGHGLAIKRPEKDSVELYDQYREFTALQSSGIVHLLEDGPYIWASSNTGLYLINKKKGVVQKYAADEPALYRLPHEDVYFLHRDQEGSYWAGTNTNGLVAFRLDSHMQVLEFRQYDKNDGLPSSVIYAIIEDDKGRLWMSTNNGISYFDKSSETFYNFSEGDGLSQLEFNRISYTQATDGQIFFGSLDGVFGFYPDDIAQPTPYDKDILITKFFLYNDQQLRDSTEELLASKTIVLQPTNQLFRLQVALIDYFNAPKIRYAYKIEGVHERFQRINGNTIELGGLPYGSFQLRVQGTGIDGRTSKRELVLDLLVLRPLYLRWWFLLLASALILLTAAQIYYWRIRQLNERRLELELMVQQRTAQIEKDKTLIETQAIQLKELDELRSKFFANISHELRTPLTLLLAPMQSIIKSKELSNKNFTYLQLMQQNGRKLLKRINELLDLSRLDANRLEVKESPTFLYPFFKTLLSTFESATNLKGIQLLLHYQLDENLQVNLDEDKVEKIISNFLSNAVKFTPKGGTISCQVSKQADQLLVSVSDTGIGILPGDLVKIFDRFYQSQNNKQQEGTGIGLSLCRELAKVLNGKVWATSEIDQGSTFYLELPITETFALKPVELPEAPEEALPANDPPLTSTAQQYCPRVLVVEDNPDLRHYISMILEEDYNIITAEHGQEALDQLQQSEAPFPSLIISDIMMPVMDGITLLKTLKHNQQWQHIPVIMLTARQSSTVRLEALRIGVDDYLTKPFIEEELKARVMNLIQNRHNREAAPAEQQPATKPLAAADLKWLESLEAIILEHTADKNFKLTEAAQAMALSYRRLQQKLKALTGLTPKQYQRSIKLAKARELLKSGQVHTLQEVMHAVGMDNYAYFTKLYLQEFGIKPVDELK